MSSHSRRFAGHRPLGALSAGALAAAVLVLSPTAVAVGDHHPAAGGSTDRAEAALDRAQALFEPKDGTDAPSRDATLVLRDLAMHRGALSPTQRLEADRLLARPTDRIADPRGAGYLPGTTPKVDCTATACFHWVETSTDAVDPDDVSANGLPDYIDAAEQRVSYVQQTYLDAGYKAVEGDGLLGGNALPDIYFANLGIDGLYGYCSSDDTVPDGGPYDVWAFCVLDDYSPAEFGTRNTPRDNLAVTAAHEYNHAVQFAYDYYEDSWLMEATATWAEDELYTDVNDNLQYLTTGPLSKPATPLDTFNQGGYQYGAWIFMRYLTERLTAVQGGMPTLVRDIWEQADGSAGAPDQYSMQAVATVLKQRGTSLSSMFATFADGNLRPAQTYSEGAANDYPTAPPGKFTKLSGGWWGTKLDHLTSASATVKPTLKSKTLKIVLDMPSRASGAQAVVTVVAKNGTTKTSMFALDKSGNGVHKYPFAKASVKAVQLTLVNAGAKYDCWQGTSYSCMGDPLNDNLTSKMKLLWYA